jgi:hypothetical protein
MYAYLLRPTMYKTVESFILLALRSGVVLVVFD